MTGTCCDAINNYLIAVIPTPSEAEAEEFASRLVPGSGLRYADVLCAI